MQFNRRDWSVSTAGVRVEKKQKKDAHTLVISTKLTPAQERAFKELSISRGYKSKCELLRVLILRELAQEGLERAIQKLPKTEREPEGEVSERAEKFVKAVEEAKP